MHARASRWTTIFPGIGTFRADDVRVTATFDADFQRFSGEVTGMASACTLSREAFPGSTTGTMLDVLTNVVQLGPDMDRDGDGLEQVVGDGYTVVECIDGDGTHIPGPDCPCDPRIADGYSVAMHSTGVRAHIVGVEVVQ